MDDSSRTWGQESTAFRMVLRGFRGRGKRTRRERERDSKYKGEKGRLMDQGPQSGKGMVLRRHQ